jgi:hypothetical protein
MRRNFSDSGRPVARRLSLARIVAVFLSGVLTAVLAGGFQPVAMALSDERTLEDVAELHDLTLIATMKGWTIEEVRAHEYAADALIDVVGKLAVERPDVFVGSAVGASPNAPPSLFIKGPADAYVQDLVASAPITIEIVDNQPYSSDELASRRHRVHSSLLNAGYVHVATRANVLNRGALEVHVGRDADGPVPERTDMVDHPMNVPEAAFGGMSATRGTDLYCTSGWSVEHTLTGETGWTTAAHCTDLREVDGIRHPGHGIHSSTLNRRYLGSYGDVAWLDAPNENEPPKFYADHDQIRDVYNVADAHDYPYGLSVCVFGRGSWRDLGRGRTCAAIWEPRYECGTMNLVVVRPDITIYHDSGAGWSRYHKAFGSHYGACVGQGIDSAFMRTYNFWVLSVRVRIQE